MSQAPPPGVVSWDTDYGKKAARKNTILAVYGKAKTGKSELCTRSTGPLYYAHFDPNDSLDAQLLAREAAGLKGEVFAIKCPPVPYRLLTEEKAHEYVKQLEDFAAWARGKARDDDAAGSYPGVFVIDGGRRLKGYIEKWLLGESSTLGYRASRGERSGISQVQYAESNTYLADIVNAFVGSPLHLVVTFEGKDEWKLMEVDGKRGRHPTGKVRTSMPDQTSFSINAQMETLVEEVPMVVNNQRVGTDFVHKLRFDYVGFTGMGYLRGRTMPAMSLDELLDLLHSKIPADAVLDEPHDIVRANMEGFAEVDE